jgi:hypothetical protein
MKFIKKVIETKALDVDVKTRHVKIAISQLESVDRDNDIFDPKAYDKTIKENGPKGMNEIWHLLDHDHTSLNFSALSKFKELYRDGKYLIGVSEYRNSFAWREVAWPLYEAGDITQHSVGFETIKDERNNDTGVRLIKEVRLYEGSAVLWGAQSDTPMMRIVKNLLNVDDDAEITAVDKIDQLIKQIKKGRFEDDQTILIPELKRLQVLFESGEIKKIFKEPDIKSTPVGDQGNPLPTIKPTLPNEITKPGFVVECPSCKRYTYNTQGDKGYIRCHRCDSVFTDGGKLFFKL